MIACNNDRKVTVENPEKNQAKVVKEKDDRKFSELKKLTDYKKTNFLPTLEYQISKDKNSVYCATLLFAWDTIRKDLGGIMEIPSDFVDLAMLNRSKSYKNVLDRNEYKVSCHIIKDTVTARAEFNKSLSFETKLESYADRLTFDGKKLASFGMSGSARYEQKQTLEILYYMDDNNFVIKLKPKEKEHEIILFKSAKSFSTMAEMSKEIERLTDIGKTESMNQNLNWKYYFDHTDELQIPKFDFNIQADYDSLVGSHFIANSKIYRIIQAWQRTAFILDEAGAEMESEAVIAAAEAPAADESEYERPKPKKLIFDKPFLILLKKTDAPNPYFGLWIANSELLVTSPAEE